MEKVLFVEIYSLDNEDGCYASNRHFAEFFRISERQIRTYTGTLKEKGLITVTIQNRNDGVMRAAGRYARVPAEDLCQLRQNRDDLIHKFSVLGRKQTSTG
jgi:hypothetical protein